MDNRPLERQFLSKGYHFLVRIFFNTDLSDTTCVKSFRRSKIIGLIDLVPSSSSAFETVFLVEALRRGLKVKEIPVHVRDYRRSRKLLRRGVKHLVDLLSSKVPSHG